MGKGKDHWWHNEKAKRAKKSGAKKYQKYLEEERRKRENAMAQRRAKANLEAEQPHSDLPTD